LLQHFLRMRVSPVRNVQQMQIALSSPRFVQERAIGIKIQVQNWFSSAERTWLEDARMRLTAKPAHTVILDLFVKRVILTTRSLKLAI